MNNLIKRISVCFILLVLILEFSLPFVQGANEPIFYKVTKVIDGDTIQVKIGSKKEKVRLIGIDTPETVDPRKPVQCFGKEASKKAKKLMLNKKVRLEADETGSNKDKYNRLLRYVYLKNGTLVNQYLVEEGYAYAYLKFPFKYMAEFKLYQEEAESANKGLWDANTCPQAAPIIEEDKAGCLIKGNIGSTGNKIYHVVGGAYCEKTTIDELKGEKWFCSEEEAEAAGWRKSKN